MAGELTTIARPYAEAAFAHAKESGRIDAWSDALTLLATVTSDPHMAAQIGNPTVPRERIRDLLLEICGSALAAGPALAHDHRHGPGHHKHSHKHYNKHYAQRGYYYAPSPVVVYQPPPRPVYVAPPPPPPVYYAPPPVVYSPPPSLNVVIPLRF